MLGTGCGVGERCCLLGAFIHLFIIESKEILLELLDELISFVVEGGSVEAAHVCAHVPVARRYHV